MKDIGVPNPEWDDFIKALPSRTTDLCRRGACVSGGWEVSRRSWGREYVIRIYLMSTLNYILIKKKEIVCEEDLEGVYDSNKTMSSRHNKTDAHMNSQRLWQHAQGLHRFKPEGVPALRRGHGHGFLLLTKQLSSIDTLIKVKISFSQWSLTRYINI